MSTLCNNKINNKTFLLYCLEKAAKKLSDKDEFKGVTFTIDEGLRKEAGDKPVAETCIKKIRQCHILNCTPKVGQVKHYPVIERVRYCTGLFPFNRALILLLL